MRTVSFLRTGQVARETGISLGRIKWALATGRVSPARDGAGQYAWDASDVEALKRAVHETSCRPAPGRKGAAAGTP